MNRLNRKGFTLIELLAVIVILAIVLVVTIPSVISAMNNSKHSQFQNAADAATDWLNKQYDLMKLGLETDSDFNAWYNGGVYERTNAGHEGEIFNIFKSFDGQKTLTYTDYPKMYTLSNIFFHFKQSDRPTDKGKSEGIKLLTAAGISNVDTNIDTEKNNWVKIDDNDKFCIVLCADDEGSFYVNDEDTVNYVISSGCENFMKKMYTDNGLKMCE